MRSTLLLGGTLALALAAGAGWGVWSLLRRPPRLAAPEAASADKALFQVSHLGQGELIELQPQVLTPLRSVRWLPPLQGGYAVAQVLTQADHQMVALFHQGQLESLITVLKPDGVGDGFFRLAELKDAAVLDDGLALLYAGGSEAALAMILDLDTKATRWSGRLQAEHLAQDGSAWAWGAASLPVSLPGTSSKDPLPPEVGEITQILPLRGKRVLLAHRKGLSLWTGKDWKHTPNPAGDALLGFYGIPGVLAASSGRAYWQPIPGSLSSVSAEGAIETLSLSALGLPKEREKDAKLLRLRGADPAGFLWFDLAMPQLTQPTATAGPSLAPATLAPAPTAPATPQAPVTSLEPAPDPRAEWDAYLKAGLDRIYRWKPGGKLEAVSVETRWKTAGAPPTVFPPTGLDLHPEAGALLLGTDQKRWWLPLEALTR